MVYIMVHVTQSHMVGVINIYYIKRVHSVMAHVAQKGIHGNDDEYVLL